MSDVLIVTVRHVHSSNVENVVKTFKARGWKVHVWRFEWFWERVERLRLKMKRSSEMDLYQSSSAVEKETGRYGFFAWLISGFIHADALLVQSDSTALTRVIVKAAKFKRIPSLLLLNVSGILGDTYVPPDFVCDELAVTGEGVREKLRECGVMKPISIVGQPVYDDLPDPRVSDSKVVVYATENLPRRLSSSMFEMFCQAMKAFPEVGIIVRLHPSEADSSLYRNILHNFKLGGLISRFGSTREVIAESNVLVTGFSAVVLDAVVLDKPVICINNSGLHNPIPFSEYGVAFEVGTIEDLKDKLLGLLYGDSGKLLEPNRKQFVETWCHKLDGQASNRVVDLVENMVMLRQMEHDAYLISDYERMVNVESLQC